MTKKVRRKWTGKETEYLITAYNQKPLHIIAIELNRTDESVAHKCAHMRQKDHKLFDKTSRAYKPYWSDVEFEILTNNYGIKSNKEIGRLVGRTEVAIEDMAKKLKLSYFDNFYRCTDLAIELNKAKAQVCKWIKRGWLKGSPAWFRGKHFGVRPTVIVEEDIVEFLRSHYDLFDPQKIKNPYFSNIVREMYQKNHNGNYISSVPRNASHKYHYPPTKLRLSH